MYISMIFHAFLKFFQNVYRIRNMGQIVLNRPTDCERLATNESHTKLAVISSILVSFVGAFICFASAFFFSEIESTARAKGSKPTNQND